MPPPPPGWKQGDPIPPPPADWVSPVTNDNSGSSKKGKEGNWLQKGKDSRGKERGKDGGKGGKGGGKGKGPPPGGKDGKGGKGGKGGKKEKQINEAPQLSDW